jgi:hypothetical protein
MADDEQHAGPGRYRVVQPLARVQVQVVRWLVEQDDRRTAKEQRGEGDQHRLAAGQLGHRAVESSRAGEAETVEPGQGAFLDIPVVTDLSERLR